MQNVDTPKVNASEKNKTFYFRGLYTCIFAFKVYLSWKMNQKYTPKFRGTLVVWLSGLAGWAG